MALAALRNRVMMPDGALVPWDSADGKQMEIAVAVPRGRWTDLAYSLMPNGRTLDYVAERHLPRPGRRSTRSASSKQSYVAGLYATGQTRATTRRRVPIPTRT